MSQLRAKETYELTMLVDRLIARRDHDRVSSSPVLQILRELIRFMSVQSEFDGSGVAHSEGMPAALDLERVADELMVSVSTVKRLVRTGEIRAVKVGGSTRVRAEDLRSYLVGLAGPHAEERSAQGTTHRTETR